jgi:hypothetical protein
MAKTARNFVELSEKIDSFTTTLAEKIDAVDAKLSQKMEDFNSKLSLKLDEVDSKLSLKIDEVDSKLSLKIDEVDSKLTKMVKETESRLTDKIHWQGTLMDEMKKEVTTALEVAGLVLGNKQTLDYHDERLNQLEREVVVLKLVKDHNDVD